MKALQCTAWLSCLCFELPAFNTLDEAIVQGRLDNALRVELQNVTSEVTSFHVLNRRQTQLSDLLQQV